MTPVVPANSLAENGHRMGRWYKSQKRSLCAAEPDRDDIAQARATRQTDIAGVGEIASERLVFLDECAVLTTMARRYGAAHVASGRLRKSPLATGSG
jgi:hypothetical protein